MKRLTGEIFRLFDSMAPGSTRQSTNASIIEACDVYRIHQSQLVSDIILVNMRAPISLPGKKQSRYVKTKRQSLESLAIVTILLAQLIQEFQWLQEAF